MQSDLRGKGESRKFYMDKFPIGVSAATQMLVFELG